MKDCYQLNCFAAVAKTLIPQAFKQELLASIGSFDVNDLKLRKTV